MSGFSVVVTSPDLAPEAAELLAQAGCTVHSTDPYPSADASAALVATTQADAVLARQGRITAAVMDASPRLRIVARHGVGVDEVDLQAASARGVMVTNAPGSNSRAVAEHALMLLLALVKDLRPLQARIAEGGWRAPGAMVGDAAGLRLGLIGCGAVGREVAKLAQAFDMRVAAYDPVWPPGGIPGVERADSPLALAAVSDVLSIHCPLTPESQGMIGAAVMQAMPRGGFVVNTARGGIVDEAALGTLLDSGHVRGAALDVFAEEPPPRGHKLREHPRVLATPHLAGVTPGSLVRMGTMAAECIVARLTGGVVPPERIVVA